MSGPEPSMVSQTVVVDPDIDAEKSDPPRTDRWLILLFTAFFTAWNYRATGRLSELPILWALIVTLYWWGQLTALVGGFRKVVPFTFPLVFLLGVASLGLFLAGMRLLLGFELSTSFILAFVLGLLGTVARRRTLAPWRHAKREGALELLATFVCLCAATFWIQHYFPPTYAEGKQVIFKPIRDNFIHTHQIILLATDADLTTIGRYGLAGEPIPFYHYASYAFPAVVASMGGITCYESTVSLWMPMALLVVGLAAFVLGQSWFGARHGLITATAVLALPDPTYWTFGLWPTGFYFYSFHRFLQIASSNAYGIAVSGLALALVTYPTQFLSLRPLVTAVLIAGSTLLLKAQIFLAALPLIVIMAIPAGIECGRRQWQDKYEKRNLITWLGLIVGGSLVSIAAILPHLRDRLPTIAIEIPIGGRLAGFLRWRTVGDTSIEWVARRAVDSGWIMSAFWRTLLVVALPLRLVTPVFLWLWFVTISSGRPYKRPDIALTIAVFIYLAYALILAPNFTPHAYGNPWDLQFVPFGWFYFVVATWTAGQLWRFFTDDRLDSWPYATFFALVLLLVTWTIGRRDTDDWQTDQLWAYVPIPQGVVECTSYLRRHSGPNDLFLDSENDPYYAVEALAERRAYVGYAVVGSYTTRTSADEILKHRLEEHADLRGLTSAEAVRQKAAELGVRWYILHPATPVRWPKDLTDSPVLEADGYRLYDLATR